MDIDLVNMQTEKKFAKFLLTSYFKYYTVISKTTNIFYVRVNLITLVFSNVLVLLVPMTFSYNNSITNLRVIF